MSVSKVKKVIVSKDSLPPVGPNNNYLVRYRIVSEDKNRYSHWSQVYDLPAHPAVRVNGGVEITDTRVTVMWEDAPGYDDKEAYDVFINVDDSGWELKESPRSHSCTFLKPTINSEISVAVQVESYLKKYDENLIIYDHTTVV